MLKSNASQDTLTQSEKKNTHKQFEIFSLLLHALCHVIRSLDISQMNQYIVTNHKW